MRLAVEKGCTKVDDDDDEEKRNQGSENFNFSGIHFSQASSRDIEPNHQHCLQKKCRGLHGN